MRKIAENDKNLQIFKKFHKFKIFFLSIFRLNGRFWRSKVGRKLHSPIPLKAKTHFGRFFDLVHFFPGGPPFFNILIFLKKYLFLANFIKTRKKQELFVILLIFSDFWCFLEDFN
jgi:hypothetical protein